MKRGLMLIVVLIVVSSFLKTWCQKLKLPVVLPKYQKATQKVLDSTIDYTYLQSAQNYVPVTKFTIVSRIPGAHYLIREAIKSDYDTLTQSYKPRYYYKYAYFSSQQNAKIKKFLEKAYHSPSQTWKDTTEYISYTGFYNHFFDWDLYDTVIYKEYDFSTNTITGGEKYIYTFLNDTLINEVYYYQYEPSSSQYKLFAKFSFSYNTFNLPSQYIIYLYQDNKTFVPFIKVTLTYNSSKLVIEELVQSWDGTTWVNSERTLYAYTSQNLLESKINQDWSSSLNQWLNTYKNTKTYNSQKLITSEFWYEWNGNTNTWDTTAGYTYQYDAQGNKTEETSYFRVGNNPYVSPFDRYTYSYNVSNQLIEETYYYWDSFQSLFFPSTRKNYTYTNELLDFVTTSFWNSSQSTWDLLFMTMYTYDTDKDSLAVRDYYYDVNTWKPTGNKRQWFYSHIDVSSIPSLKEEFLRIYPNPVSETINIELSNNITSNQPGTVTIYDYYGRILMKQSFDKSTITMDISRLPKGSYFLHVVFQNGNSFRENFIKL